jgi:molybdenum cofactor biosynthesis protein B
MTPSALRIAVLTVSDTRTEATDTSGTLIADSARRAGHELTEKRIVTDDARQIRATVEDWIGSERVDVVIVTGGTGITARDVTPEALEPLVTKAIPGFGELFRQLSFAEIGASTIQSRAFAGLCGQCLLFALPGSTGAVRLALDRIVLPQLDRTTKPCNFAELLPRIRGATAAPSASDE